MFYRPVWTCGRYHEAKKAAIMYNLIEGMSYFFEDYSALVIGTILEIGRNGHISLEEISERTNISPDSLTPFLCELSGYGLITNELPSDESIQEYRTKVYSAKCNQALASTKRTSEKLPFEVSNAEMAYTDCTGGITSVMFELTYSCSEKCIHCYNPGATRNDKEISARGNREELTLEEYKRIIDELYEQGLIKVCLSGGDPFSKPIVWDIIDYLYDKEIAFDIFTNGQRITQCTKRLADYFPRLVGISLYSGIAEEHDYITRIRGSWEKSMQVIEQLASLAVPINLKCCIMRTNVKSYYLVKEIAKRYGAVPQFEISITDSIEGDKCARRHLRLTPEQLKIVLRDDDIPLYVGKEAPNYGGQPRLTDNNACGAGYNTFCISPEGFLMPCCAFHTVFGELKKESLKQILSGSKELQWWQKLTLTQYEECGKLEYCNYCNLCPGNNFVEWGTPLKAGENNCYIAKIRYALAKEMSETGYDPLHGKSLIENLQALSNVGKEDLAREISNNHINQRLKIGG